MRLIQILIILIVTLSTSSSYAKCTGRFVNPATDICWDCMFPITIGSATVTPQESKDDNKPDSDDKDSTDLSPDDKKPKPSNRSSHTRPDTRNPSSPICHCPNPKALGMVTPGLAVGFWEPSRMVDVTKRPFCMTSIGGIDIETGLDLVGTGSAPFEGHKEGRIGNWHVHWYNSPIISLLNLLLDVVCQDMSNFALSYMSEFDPLWNNDLLAFIMHPESILFGNMVAELACVADCISSTVHKPLDPLFWCSGCQGGMYPFTGNVSEHFTSIQSSSLAAQRFHFKMHRQMLELITSGPEAICHPYPFPIIKKSQYRLQTTIPIPGKGPYGCNPYGRSTVLHESFKEIPITGEDFGYYVWRKRNCCIN